MQKKFKQSWNSRINRWVKIDCSDGIKGGVTGEVSREPFPDIEIHKGKNNEDEESEKKSAGKKEVVPPVEELDVEDVSEDDSWAW